MTIQELEILLRLTAALVQQNTLAINSIANTANDYATTGRLTAVDNKVSGLNTTINLIASQVSKLSTNLTEVNKLSKMLDTNIINATIDDILLYDGDRWTNNRSNGGGSGGVVPSLLYITDTTGSNPVVIPLSSLTCVFTGSSNGKYMRVLGSGWQNTNGIVLKVNNVVQTNISQSAGSMQRWQITGAPTNYNYEMTVTFFGNETGTAKSSLIVVMALDALSDDTADTSDKYVTMNVLQTSGSSIYLTAASSKTTIDNLANIIAITGASNASRIYVTGTTTLWNLMGFIITKDGSQSQLQNVGSSTAPAYTVPSDMIPYSYRYHISVTKNPTMTNRSTSIKILGTNPDTAESEMVQLTIIQAAGDSSTLPEENPIFVTNTMTENPIIVPANGGVVKLTGESNGLLMTMSGDTLFIASHLFRVNGTVIPTLDTLFSPDWETSQTITPFTFEDSIEIQSNPSIYPRNMVITVSASNADSTWNEYDKYVIQLAGQDVSDIPVEPNYTLYLEGSQDLSIVPAAGGYAHITGNSNASRIILYQSDIVTGQYTFKVNGIIVPNGEYTYSPRWDSGLGGTDYVYDGLIYIKPNISPNQRTGTIMFLATNLSGSKTFWLPMPITLAGAVYDPSLYMVSTTPTETAFIPSTGGDVVVSGYTNAKLIYSLDNPQVLLKHTLRVDGVIIQNTGTSLELPMWVMPNGSNHVFTDTIEVLSWFGTVSRDVLIRLYGIDTTNIATATKLTDLTINAVLAAGSVVPDDYIWITSNSSTIDGIGGEVELSGSTSSKTVVLQTGSIFSKFHSFEYRYRVTPTSEFSEWASSPRKGSADLYFWNPQITYGDWSETPAQKPYFEYRLKSDVKPNITPKPIVRHITIQGVDTNTNIGSSETGVCQATTLIELGAPTYPLDVLLVVNQTEFTVNAGGEVITITGTAKGNRFAASVSGSNSFVNSWLFKRNGVLVENVGQQWYITDPDVEFQYELTAAINPNTTGFDRKEFLSAFIYGLPYGVFQDLEDIAYAGEWIPVNQKG